MKTKILLIAISLSLFSCEKGNDDLDKDNDKDNSKKCYVGEMTTDTGESTVFEYNADMKITKIEDTEGEDIMKMMYTYNSDGLMNSMTVYTDYGEGLEEDGTTMFTYDGTNKIIGGKITKIEEGATIIMDINYSLDKNKNLKTVTAIMKIPGTSFEIKVRTEFVFEDGNLVDFKEYDYTDQPISHIKYKYDNKKNPFYNLGNKYSVINEGHESWGSKNNVISEEIILSSYSSTGTYLYKLEYDDNNYPVKWVTDWGISTLKYIKCEE